MIEAAQTATGFERADIGDAGDGGGLTPPTEHDDEVADLGSTWS